MKKINRWLMVAVVIYCLNVFPGILRGFTAFTYDNGRDMLAAYRILYERDFTLIGPTTGIPGVFHGAWCFYWLIIPFVIFGGDPIGVALTVGLINLIGLVIFYFLIKDLLNRQAANLAALVYASAPHILTHNQLAHNNLLPFFISLSLFLINKLFKNPSRKLLFIFGLCIGFLFEFEFGGGLFILLYNFFFVLIFLLLKRKSVVDFFVKLTFFTSGIILPITPRILFELRHGFLMTRAIIENLLHPQVRFYYFQNLSLQARIVDRLKTFLNLWNDVFPAEIKSIGPFLLIGMIIVLVVARQNIKREKSFFLRYTMLLIVTVIAAWMWYKDAVWDTYTTGFPVYFFVILAYGLYIFNLKLKRVFRVFLFAAAAVLLTKGVLTNTIMFNGKMTDPSAIVNQRKAIDFIYQDAVASKTFAVGVYSPSWFAYPYDYWFLWLKKFHGKRSPESLWHAKNNYLIVEPADNETTAKQWFARFMDKNATLVSTKYFDRLKVEKWYKE